VTDDEWRALVADFVAGAIGPNEFHDRFFDGWHAQPRHGPFCPNAIEKLFFTVEAYCPDPTLRRPGDPFEADEHELRRDAEIALQRLDAEIPQRKLT
jgi:hypothetical protein